MSEFRVDYSKLKKNAATVKGVSNALDTNIRSLDDAAKNIGSMSGGAYGTIASTIRGIESELAQLKKTSIKMGEVLEQTADKYKTTESKIAGNTVQTSAQTPQSPSQTPQPFVKTKGGYSVGNADASAGVTKEDGSAEAKADASASVWTGEASYDVGDGLIQGTATGTALGAEANAKAGYINDPFTTTAYATAGASAYGFKGSYKQSALGGLHRYQANGEVLSANAEAKAYASLMHRGIFLPSAGAEASANAQVAKGDVKEAIGNDDYNVNAGAEGSVVGAEAEAKAKVGAYTDDEGNTVYGATVGASAEAYLAKGEVSGGFTIKGIEFKTTFGGQVGVGASAEAEINSESLNISAGLAALLGLEGGISIDWSGFEW